MKHHENYDYNKLFVCNAFRNVYYYRTRVAEPYLLMTKKKKNLKNVTERQLKILFELFCIFTFGIYIWIHANLNFIADEVVIIYLYYSISVYGSFDNFIPSDHPYQVWSYCILFCFLRLYVLVLYCTICFDNS